MSRRSNGKTAVTILACALAQSACATKWPERNAKSGTLEAELEQVFAAHSRECSIIPQNAQSASYIPQLIKDEGDAIGLQKAVIVVGDDSVGRIFGFLYDASNFNSIQSAARIDSGNFVQVLSDADINPRLHSSATGYRQTCSSYVNAMMKANVSVPPAQVAAALSSEENSTTHLILVHGTFESPIYQKIRIHDLQTNLGFWEAYAAKGKYTADWRYLKGFEGLSVFRTEDSDRKQKFNVTGSASTFGLSLSLDAGITQNTQFQLSEYKNYIYSSDPKELFAPTPKPSEIVAVFAAIVSRTSSGIRLGFTDSEKGAELVALDQKWTSFWYDIDGLPQSLCADTKWSAVPNSGEKTGSETLVNPRLSVAPLFSGANYSGTCRFSVSGYPSNNAFVDKTRRAVVHARFDSIDSLSDTSSGGAVKLSLPIEQPMRTSVDPDFQPPASASPSIQTDSAGNKLLVWNVAFSFHEVDRAWDKSRVSSVSLQSSDILCKSTGHHYTPTMDPADGRKIGFHIDTIGRGTAIETDCILQIELLLPLVGGGQITRDIAVPLAFPLISA